MHGWQKKRREKAARKIPESNLQFSRNRLWCCQWFGLIFPENAVVCSACENWCAKNKKNRDFNIAKIPKPI
jgi:hypothetical protein